MTLTTLLHKKHILALDGMRFVAVLCVWLGHATSITNLHTEIEGQKWLLSLPQIGMSLFFILSGFVIHYNYSALSTREWKTIRSFLIARFSRLYPLYGLIFLFILFAGRHLPAHIRWTDILTYALGMQSWYYHVYSDRSLIYVFGDWMAVTWSISTEFFFYLVYIFIARYIVRIQNIRTHFLIAIALYAALLLFLAVIYHFSDAINASAVAHFGNIADETLNNGDDSLLRWLLYFSPYCRIVGFFLGTLAANLVMRHYKPRNSMGIYIILLALVGAFMAANLYLPAPLSYNKAIICAPLVAAFIFLSAAKTSRISQFLSLPFIRKMGEISYSIYMLQGACFVGTLYILKAIGIENLSVMFVISFFITMLASLISYHCVECPFKRLIRKTLE